MSVAIRTTLKSVMIVAWFFFFSKNHQILPKKNEEKTCSTCLPSIGFLLKIFFPFKIPCLAWQQLYGKHHFGHFTKGRGACFFEGALDNFLKTTNSPRYYFWQKNIEDNIIMVVFWIWKQKCPNFKCHYPKENFIRGDLFLIILPTS